MLATTHFKNMGGATRLSIPTELERQIKTEAGHRCAIPTCRQWPVVLAHIIPYRIVKGHSFDNLIALCPTCHARYDNAKDIDRASMRYYKARLRANNLAGFEERPLQSSELGGDTQKEVGPFRHMPLLNEWFTNLPRHKQFKFYKISIVSGTVFAVISQLSVGLTLNNDISPAVIITPGLTIVTCFLLLFLIRREYSDGNTIK